MFLKHLRRNNNRVLRDDATTLLLLLTVSGFGWSVWQKSRAAKQP